MNTQIVEFNNHNLNVIDRNNQMWLSSSDVAIALGYEKTKSITNLYNIHKNEFDIRMTEVIESMTSNNKSRRQRIFNREGAWLIGMFARTPKAAEFRRWVLKVLGAVADSEPLKQVQSDITVREHKRALPSRKKEIVLSEKAKQEIGGIAKAVVTKTLDEKLPQYFRPSDKLPDKVISAAFHQTADEIQAKKAKELKEYRLTSSEAEIIEKIRSANAFNMLNLFMGVSKKLSA